VIVGLFVLQYDTEQYVLKLGFHTIYDEVDINTVLVRLLEIRI